MIEPALIRIVNYKNFISTGTATFEGFDTIYSIGGVEEVYIEGVNAINCKVAIDLNECLDVSLKNINITQLTKKKTPTYLRGSLIEISEKAIIQIAKISLLKI